MSTRPPQYQPQPQRQRRKQRAKPEEQVQRVCVEILTYFVPPPPEGPAWTAINPVAAKSRAVAGVSKAMGLRPGWPDFELLYQGRSIYIEFKAPRGAKGGGGGRVDPEQEARAQEIEAAGGVVLVCRSVEEFVEILDRFSIPCSVDRSSIAARSRTP